MDVTVTLKNRLYPTSKVSREFSDLSRMYARACSYGSKVYFDHYGSLSSRGLDKHIYRVVRRLFGLKAQEAGSVPRTVTARYQAVNTQLFQQYPSYKDLYTKKYFHISKNANNLWRPIHFKTPQADLVYKNDWSVVPTKNRLSINTLGKRAKVPYYLPDYFKKYLKMPHKLGTAKLVHNGGHWYLHVSCTVDVPKPDIKLITGSDRGLRFTRYTYDGKRSSQTKGLAFRKRRGHFLKQREILQHKGTPSARRKLAKISGRENCWMSTIDHRISKALVKHYPAGTKFYLENLRGVKFEAENASQNQKYGRASWPFYELGTDLSYKALLNGSEIDHIQPQYTSQRCPNCGNVCADSRDHGKHVYHCLYCGYSSNDDRIGAMNIRFLGWLDSHGYLNPIIKQDSTVSYSKYVHARSKKTGRKLKKKIKKRFVLSRTKALKLNVKSRNQP